MLTHQQNVTPVSLPQELISSFQVRLLPWMPLLQDPQASLVRFQTPTDSRKPASNASIEPPPLPFWNRQTRRCPLQGLVTAGASPDRTVVVVVPLAWGIVIVTGGGAAACAGTAAANDPMGATTITHDMPRRRTQSSSYHCAVVPCQSHPSATAG